MTAKQSGLRGKVRDGTVVSDKMQKTVVVAVDRHPEGTEPEARIGS